MVCASRGPDSRSRLHSSRTGTQLTLTLTSTLTFMYLDKVSPEDLSITILPARPRRICAASVSALVMSARGIRPPKVDLRRRIVRQASRHGFGFYIHPIDRLRSPCLTDDTPNAPSVRSEDATARLGCMLRWRVFQSFRTWESHAASADPPYNHIPIREGVHGSARLLVGACQLHTMGMQKPILHSLYLEECGFPRPLMMWIHVGSVLNIYFVDEDTKRSCK
ncbi:hypothetical protein LX36DRAFT_346114 [Colletotrichum falcatum]|nr:hypothetical protein LX36DRAFT_346114 [Colletotrichum falcatum]